MSPRFSTLESVSKLPPTSRVLDPSTQSLGLRADFSDNMAILLESGSLSNSSAGRVLLVVRSGFEKTAAFLSSKQKIEGAHYTITTILLAEQGQIKAIYDRQDETQEGEEAWRNTPINEYINKLVTRAIDNDVSDIHFEVRARTSSIRWRRNGMMQVCEPEISTRFMRSLCYALYTVEAEEEGKSSNFREDRDMAATISRMIGGHEVKLRFQSTPVYPGGFDAVLRVLMVGANDERPVELSELGYSPDQVEALRRIVSRPLGALVLAGVTGSGKSTTLKNLVMWLNEKRGYKSKFFTIEDPPEFRIPRVSQIAVRQPEVDEAGSSENSASPYLAPIRAIMRMDPDVIMLGEIRDNFTADAMKKLTQTGHQVFTTIHTVSALAITGRLEDLGINTYTLASTDFLTGMVYQRLIQVLCPHCSLSFVERLQSSSAQASDLELAKRIETVIGQDGLRNVRIEGPGCSHCGNTGISGRTVCAEIISPDFTMLRLFRENKAVEAKEYWRSQSDGDPLSTNMRGKTALEHGVSKLAQGLVSPYMVELILGSVDSDYSQWLDMKRDHALNPPMANTAGASK